MLDQKDITDLRDMPRILWVVLVAAIGLFLFSVAMIVAMPWKLDQGMATLVGAVVGFGIIAWQAKIGFSNLIKSQANQSTLDREAREHQALLDVQTQERNDAAKSSFARIPEG